MKRIYIGKKLHTETSVSQRAMSKTARKTQTIMNTSFTRFSQLSKKSQDIPLQLRGRTQRGNERSGSIKYENFWDSQHKSYNKKPKIRNSEINYELQSFMPLSKLSQNIEFQKTNGRIHTEGN